LAALRSAPDGNPQIFLAKSGVFIALQTSYVL
jgi:hypothetical protein